MKFILPFRTLGTSTLLPAGLSAASDLDPGGTGSCDINFRTRKPECHRGNRATPCNACKTSPQVLHSTSCLDMLGPLTLFSFVWWWWGEDSWRSLYVSAVTMVCEEQHRHWLSSRSPLFNHMGLSGDHCVADGQKTRCQIFPLLLTLYGNFC